jgi:hypothetical protein
MVPPLDHHARDVQPVEGRELVEPRHDLLAHECPQVRFDRRGEITAVRRCNRAIAVRHDPTIAAHRNRESRRLTVEQNRRTVAPPLGRSCLPDAQALPFDPRAVLLEKAQRFGTRPATRHRHAHRAIVPHAHDVPAGAADADDMDGQRLGSGRRGRQDRGLSGRPQERELELHERMIAGSFVPERDDRIDGHRPPRRDVAGEHGDERQEQRDRREAGRIGGRDVVELGRDGAPCEEGTDEPEHDPECRQSQRSPVSRNLRPIGSSFPHRRFAIDWLISATPDFVDPSLSVRSRPRTSAMSSACRRCGDVPTKLIGGSCPFSTLLPSTIAWPPSPPPPIGTKFEANAALVPGSDSDVLVYQTEPLDADVTLAGPITALLHVSTTGTDADWIVKVIDVYPDRYPDENGNTTNTLGGYHSWCAAT